MDFSTILDLARSGIVNISSLATGLLGIVLTVVFYMKSRRSKRLCYRVPDRRYRGKGIEKGTALSIALWNGGSEVIKASDIASTDLIHLRTSHGNRFLGANILTCTTDANQLNAAVNPNDSSTVIISFEYLNPGDGGVIGLLHEGNWSDNIDIEIRGSIIGAAKRKAAEPNRIGESSLLKDFLMYGIPFVYSWVVALQGLAIGTANSFGLGLFIFGAMFYPVVMPIVYSIRYKRRTPRGLESFEIPPDVSKFS